MTSICLVRHGETDWNKEGRVQGSIDIPLNEDGILQAQECAEFLQQFSWDIIITSPLQRAKQTAEIINEKLQIPFIVMDDFREKNYGDAEGMTIQERNTKFPDRKYPNEESRTILTDRVMNGINIIYKNYPNQKILLVAHGGVINAILADLSGGEIGSGKTKLVNACISNIYHSDKKWSIKDYNQIAHLSKYNDKGKV